MKLEYLVAIVACAPGVALAADFSGTWKIDDVFNGAVAVIRCTIVQAGSRLSGSCKPEAAGLAATDLAGTADGSKAKWGYDLVFNGKPARVDYVVDLAADGTLKGSLLRNGSASPITAVRQ
jgi:hypothetical protein